MSDNGTTDLNFSEALDELKSGNCVFRTSWPGTGQYIELQIPDANSKMTKPYFYMNTTEDEVVPWLPSFDDLLADDWQVL